MLQCPDCKGTGWDDKTDKDCELCDGHGQISKRDLHGEGKHVQDFREALAAAGMGLVEAKKKPKSKPKKKPKVGEFTKKSDKRSAENYKKTGTPSGWGKKDKD
jgi:RecJ-like exonuclease